MMYTVNATINGIEVPVEVSTESIEAVGFVHGSEVPCTSQDIEDARDEGFSRGYASAKVDAFADGYNSAKKELIGCTYEALADAGTFEGFTSSDELFSAIKANGLVIDFDSRLKELSEELSISELRDGETVKKRITEWIEENMKKEKYFEVEIGLIKTVVYRGTAKVAVKANSEDEAMEIVENYDICDLGDKLEGEADWYEDDCDYEIDDVYVCDECDEYDFIVIE